MTLTDETRQLIISNSIDKAHQAIKDAKMLLNSESNVQPIYKEALVWLI